MSLFADADFAGDRDDSKSTSGNFLVLTGSNTYFPLTWSSTKQTSTSRSTTESEVVSLAQGVVSEAILASILWTLVLGRDIKTKIYEDNQATITVVRKGYSKKLKHIFRTHKVKLGSLKEVCVNDNTELVYIETKKQAADIFTKALAPNLWDHALEMLGIQKMSRLPLLMRRTPGSTNALHDHRPQSPLHFTSFRFVAFECLPQANPFCS